MAFAKTNTASAAANTNTDNSWKADGFINLYLPSQGGAKRKLGAIALKLSKDNERALLEWLNADEANISKLAAKLIVEYHSAAPNPANNFALE